MKGVNDIGEGVTCFEEYNVPYHQSKSIAMLPRPGRNGVAISKQKVLPNSTENYSHGSDGFISRSSLRKSKSFFFDPQNDERLNLTMETLEYKNLDFNSIGEENSRTSENIITMDASAEENKFSEVLLKSEAITNCVFERVKRKRFASFMDFSPRLYPGSRDCNKPEKIEWTVKEGPKEKDSESSDEKRDILDSVEEGSVQGSHLTPDDVVRVIGQRLFQKARHTILDHQKIFSGQILELHRLIKVQRSMARSPEKLPERNFHANEPPVISPSMDKPLYAEKVHFPPKIPMTPSIIPSTNAKIVPPYIFHQPIGNKWLIPIKSPYEGLVYNRFLRPCFPSNGVTFGSEFGQSYVCNLATATVNNASAENVEEPVEKDGLALFPMTPSSEVLKDENGGPKSGVVKVVPHNQNLAPESAARIFESLKEERRVLRLSSCT